MNDSSPEREPQSAASPVPIVAIGASAGGLEACSELLRHLSPPTGRAFVIIQHLDPNHPSHLAPLLAKICQLPVEEAINGQVPLDDHVYVITPDTRLELRDGRLHTAPRPVGRFTPVDDFLSSLAVAQREQAIGVILSGTGVDGTVGAQAIKRYGGTVYAQDETAQQTGMPASAVAVAAVDHVLPPDQIARALQHSEPADDTLKQLFGRLKRITSVAYGEYKRSTILRRIHRRLALLHMRDLQEYLVYIDAHPAELEQLHRDLLIHVTAFFRDPATFDALRATVVPKLLGEATVSRPIRVWVPGCSTGEEVYSLAICLLEGLGSTPHPPAIKIFATDISDEALDTARAGRYPETIAAEVSPARLENYFFSIPGGYQIGKRVRDLCVFARHDMTSDPPFSNLDLISCRNVLIYLGTELQRRILPLFHYALRDQGILLLGGAESVGNLAKYFTVLDARQRIYSRKSSARRLPLSFSHGESVFSSALTAPLSTAAKIGGADFQREAERAMLAHYAPPGVIVSTEMEILQSRGDTAPFLTLAPGIASLNLLKMAREGLLLDLRAAIDECRRSGRPARRDGIRIKGLAPPVSVQVLPVLSGNDHGFSVMFEPNGPSEKIVAPPPDAQSQPADLRPSSATPIEIEALREELADTRAHMQSIIEQLESSNEELRAANEEILSSNEELQSTNEELQTAKEELQATNEELSTVNDEIQHRIREAVSLSDDLTNLFRNINLPIVMVGQELQVRRFTPAAGELFNLIPGDIGRPLTDIKTRLAGDDLHLRIRHVLETLTGTDEEIHDEAGRIYSISIRPYRTQDNRLDGAVVSVMDIDAIKRGEAAMRAARDFSESIIDTIGLPLVVLDDRLLVVSANRAFLDSAGIAATAIHATSLEHIPGSIWYSAAVHAWLEGALSSDARVPSLEVQSVAAPGATRSFTLEVRRLSSVIPAAPRLLLKIEDTTALRLRESQQRQSQKMEAVGQLASGIAHDFNNLLTVINGYATLLRARITDDVKSGEMLTAILQAGERAATITGQLLAFSRRSMLNAKVIDLRQLLGEFEVMLRHLIDESILVRMKVDPAVDRILIDPSLVTQMLLNLSINARDAMPGGGLLVFNVDNVTLTAEAPEGCSDMAAGTYVRMTVTDTGMGIEPGTLPHIFEPFFTTKDVGKGTGMGLASVYGAVKQSGGYIYVDSKPGAGTTFTVYLPRVNGPLNAVLDAETSLDQLPTGEEVLLLVEDEADVRTLARTVLESVGYTVLDAANGLDALTLVQTHPGPIDLLVTDVVMPHLGGYELARQLQSARPALGVLFVSGYHEQSLVDSGFDPAVNFLLVKPYSPVALIQRVRRQLDLRQQAATEPRHSEAHLSAEDRHEVDGSA